MGMRIVMPLFWFEVEGIASYAFDNTGLSIAPFDKSAILKIPLFSEQDLRHMRDDACWALIYDSPEIAGYKSKVNTLLLAFKIFCEKRYPFIKYRLCSLDHSLCARLNDTITYNYSRPRTAQSFGSADLVCIKDGFLSLIEMDQVSIRTHNALYFLYRAWHNTKWIDSFILMMCSLESLFSKDKPGGATAAITTRVSSLLSLKPKCAKSDIEDLYELRSHMTHGNIEASDDPGENLGKLNHLEFVTIECFRALAERKLYKEYADKKSRDRLMGTLKYEHLTTGSTESPKNPALGDPYR
jgi:hypothetical protein